MGLKLTKDDLAQMSRPYFQSLEHECLVEVACNLLDFGTELLERLEQNSRNSSRPPSSDNPFEKGNENNPVPRELDEKDILELDEKDILEKDEKDTLEKDEKDTPEEDEKKQAGDNQQPDTEKRSPGRQPGSQGFWRSETPVPEDIVPHYPEQCAVCNKALIVPEGSHPHMGYYVFELEKLPSGIRIVCTLHHYYALVCSCGHETKARPGEGFVSSEEGRKNDLKLTEYVLVGPMLAAFTAALSSRYRMSRPKIREYIAYWLNTELSVGTIDRCVREAGIACFPVVEELIDDLQKEDMLNADETPWYEKGCMKWLWVAISKLTAVYIIGTRKKEELLKLITEAFLGWLITDGYGAYRSHEKRQRCLAHLIRKAVALTGAVNEKARKMGDWFLKELRGLIKIMAEEGEDATRKCSPVLARLKKACNLGAEEDHPKLRALSREILNDWDAVVAFVKNPGLPPTNNEAERALRHAVISRRISFGTRTTEGSRAYAALLSV
ncbi:MAG: IS66 family transposase, partial [bacterium]|nr:IS66 family transposase [bacterium]